MSVLLVGSDVKGAGKSATALGLAATCGADGRSVAAFQPFAASGASGSDGGDADTLARLGRPCPSGWPREVGDGGPSDADVAALNAQVAGGTADMTILEMPAGHPDCVARVAEALDAKALVVAASRRGMRGGELSSWPDALGERLAGVLVNGVPKYQGTEARQEVAPSFAEADITLVGMIPEDRALLTVSVEQVRSGLDGRYVVDEGDMDAPIEWFQVGAMSLDPGELRFGIYERNAVVVRGDRPDIQMSALNASVSCLVLTGGIEPIEYISYEAREEETPVMVVEPDTLTTMTLLNDVTSSARMDTAAKVARFAALLRERADLGMLGMGA